MTIEFEDQVVDSLPNYGTMFRFLDNAWVRAESPPEQECSATSLYIIAWNMDAKATAKGHRLQAAIRHIKEKDFLNADPPPASCILLQEVHSRALPSLLALQWIRQNYFVTPISSEGWKRSFGQVTLVSRDVPVSIVFSVNLPMTALGRQALFTDLHISVSSAYNPDSRVSATRTIRIANTHLETGDSDMDLRSRAKQLNKIARMLNVPNVDVCICTGSMCSVDDVDKQSIAKAGFADAFTRRERGCETWGHRYVGQPGMPAGRLDKILYFPTPGVNFSRVARVGVTLKCEVPDTASGPIYVSDHTGVRTTLTILNTGDII